MITTDEAEPKPESDMAIRAMKELNVDNRSTIIVEYGDYYNEK